MQIGATTSAPEPASLVRVVVWSGPGTISCPESEDAGAFSHRLYRHREACFGLLQAFARYRSCASLESDAVAAERPNGDCSLS
jgi:hypothetical protein